LICKAIFALCREHRPVFRKSGLAASGIPDAAHLANAFGRPAAATYDEAGKKMPSSSQEGIFNRTLETLLFVGFGTVKVTAKLTPQY